MLKGQHPVKPSEIKDFESNDVMLGALKSTTMNIDRGSSVISSFVFNTSVLGEAPGASKQRRLQESQISSLAATPKTMNFTQTEGSRLRVINYSRLSD